MNHDYIDQYIFTFIFRVTQDIQGSVSPWCWEGIDAALHMHGNKN